jgi:hypothetical protein
MPIEMVWGDDTHSIIVSRFSDDWTWDDYHESDQILLIMAAEVAHRIDIISDFSSSNGLPEGNLLANAGRGHNMEVPNLGIIVAVQPPRIIEALRPIAKQITGRENRFSASTLEEAYTLIAQSRQNDNPAS